MVVKLEVQDNIQEFKQTFKELGEAEVLVGVPEKSGNASKSINNAQKVFIHTHGIRRRSMRKEMDEDMDRGKKYSEAYELYIQSHGSPLWHAPPRPIIEPAIEAHSQELAELLEVAAEAQMSGNAAGFQQSLQRAGMQAQNVVRAWFTDSRNGWAPNAPSTIKEKGSDRPLIDTGSMRRAITYVIKNGGGGSDD